MQRVRVKICGITVIEDAMAAVDAGADAIGLVFYKHSPRYVDIETAAAIAVTVPPFVSKVGLFVNADQSTIKDVLSNVQLDLIQFHGSESPAECEGFDMPYIKAVNVDSDLDYAESEARYHTAAALLLDTHVKGVPGGTGQSFDWTRIPSRRNKPLILAGGLTAENVGNAVRLVQPYAVDVSSGVETSSHKKSTQRINAFLEAVRLADSNKA